MKDDGYEQLKIVSPFFNSPVYHTEQTGSTMTDSEQLINGKGLPGFFPLEPLQSGTVVATDYQSAGVGRLPGRRWDGDWGKNCLFTLLLHRNTIDFSPGLIPLLSGLALSKVLYEAYAIETKIKWPNDLLVMRDGHYKKISGILCRMPGSWILLGMGVNCNQLSFDEELMDKAVSIKMVSGTTVEMEDFLLKALEGCRIIFKEAAFHTGELKKAIENKLFHIGEETEIIQGRPPNTKRVTAVITGIGEDGGLLYRKKYCSDIEQLFAGEVSIGDGPYEELP